MAKSGNKNDISKLSFEEAIKNLKEATELYLEEFPMKKTGKPFVSFFEVTSHAKTSKAVRA